MLRSQRAAGGGGRRPGRVLGVISVDAISDALRAPVAVHRRRGDAAVSRADASAREGGQPFFRVDWVARERRTSWPGGSASSCSSPASPSWSASCSRSRSRCWCGAIPASTGRSWRSTGLLYSIPSIALFVLLIPITGLSLLTAEIALVGYAMVILVRNIVTALRSVPPEVLEAADGMGYTASQRLWRVEVPIAVPIIVAGLRIATVTIMGLVTIATLIGMGGLGYLIVNIGIKQRFPTATLVGVALVVVLSVIIDAVLLFGPAPAHAVVSGARGLRRTMR